MKVSIQNRLIGLLLLVTLPVAATCLFIVSVIDTRMTERVHAGLQNDHRLEAERIEAALDQYLDYAKSLAYSPELTTLLDWVNTESEPVEVLLRALQMHAESAQVNAAHLDLALTELKIVAPDGSELAKTTGFSWEPHSPAILEQAFNTAEAAYGNAFRNLQGEDRLAIVVPIKASENATGGTDNPAPTINALLLVEMKLGPVVDLVEAHEGFGETVEAHIAHRNQNGDVEFITLLRFARDAAFSKVVPKEKDLPIVWSLDSPEPRVVRSPDYRAIDSLLAIGTLPSVGWGLVVKIDYEEAFRVVAEVKRAVWTAGIVTMLLVFLSWLIHFRPLMKRLKATAIAADQLAAGDYRYLINDNQQDEISALANSIDSLASDLLRDNMLRDQAEKKLKYQAEHDALTGLINRKHAQDVIEALDRESPDAAHSVLFLDLDRFKAINDQFGHHIGDEILIAISTELQDVVSEDCRICRWGGDEFVVIAPDADELVARRIAKQISQLFGTTFGTSAGCQSLGCSIGIATTSDEQGLTECVQLADARMYDAKQDTKGVGNRDFDEFFTSVLANGSAEVRYQPIVRGSDETGWTVTGVEAHTYVRNHDGEFTPAKDLLLGQNLVEFSTQLDIDCIPRVCKDLAAWRAAGLVAQDFYCAINLCGPTIRREDFAHYLETEAVSLQVPPANLVLGLCRDTAKINTDAVEASRTKGARIAITDFDLHHSGLDRLFTLSPDVVTFNRTWLDGVCTSGTPMVSGSVQHKRSIALTHLFDACNEMKIDYIASGVTGQAQVHFLQDLGAGQFQGPWFDKALPQEQMARKLLNLEPSRWSNPQRPQLKAAS